jgi:hypothetical protein
VPPDVTWLGPFAGCGAWLGTEMDPPLFGVVAPRLVPLPAELLLLLLVPVLGDVVASAG